MKIMLEILTAFLFVSLGYIAVCAYLNEIKWNAVSKKILMPNKNKYRYLTAAVLINAVVLFVFFDIYTITPMIHQLKLIILINLIFPMAAVDYKVCRIPNIFIIAALFVRAVVYAAEFIMLPSAAIEVLKEGVVGALVIGGFFLLILLVFKNSIGMGDIKLFVVMALYQGMWGAMNSIFFSLTVSFFLSVFLLVTKKKSRKDTISFAPSILVGTSIAICISGM